MATQDLAATDLVVRVLNEDDNLPEFVDPTVYFFVYNPLHSSGRGRYPAVGRVRATDADGDALLYRVRGGAGGAKGVEGPSAALRGGGCCIVVPQTGEVIVVNGEFNATVLSVDAVERDNKVSRIDKENGCLPFRRDPFRRDDWVSSLATWNIKPLCGLYFFHFILFS